MKKQHSSHNSFMSDDEFARLLKRHDPREPFTSSSLASLEADILAKVTDQPRISARQRLAESLIPAWMIEHGWTGRAAGFASVLIIAAGFMIGQFDYSEDSNLGANTTGLLAFVDEPLMHYIPTTETSKGDRYENVQ